MKLSYNWLRELIDFNGDTPPTPDEMATTLTSLGLEVEQIEDQSAKYNGFYIGYVEDKQPHPDADKLNLCTVSLGDKSQTVICGAPNVDKGQKIVLGTEGAVVPSAGFALSRRKIRGIESNGMICSKKELELGEDHDGIWVLDSSAKAGQPLADYLSLNDTVIEIAITPNRADCTGHIGVARELVAFFGGKLRLPNAEISVTETYESEGEAGEHVTIEIESPELCPRYAAKIVKGVTIGESPQWLKSRLGSCGVRSINNIVDITNYLLMLTGQPLHAFDYDTIADKKIAVGTVAEGTEFTTLDGKVRKLDGDMLLIKDGRGPIAVAGVMGGLDSEITDNSTNVLIESAYFSPGSVRKTARTLGIHSDASYRFERGIDYGNVLYVADLAAKMIADLGGGQIVNGTVDEYPKPIQPVKVELKLEYVSRFLGEDISGERIIEILKGLDFEVVGHADSGNVVVTSPTWRVDINKPIDLVEEVARVYGYDNLPNSLSPSINFSELGTPELLAMPQARAEVRDLMIGFGYMETMHPNQVDPEAIAKYGIDPVELKNPLGADFASMRTSLMHSMLKTVSRNNNQGNQSLRLFEIGKVFFGTGSQSSFVQGYSEQDALCVALCGNNTAHWSSKNSPYDFYDIKGLVEALMAELTISKVKIKQSHDISYPLSADSLDIFFGKSKVGRVGAISKAAKKDYDIDQDVYLLELDLSSLYSNINGKDDYQKVSPYPTMKRDLAFVVDKDVTAGKLLNIAEQNGGKYLQNVDIFDVYEGENLDGRKSLALSIQFGSKDKTLTDEEIKTATDKIINTAQKQLNAELRG